MIKILKPKQSYTTNITGCNDNLARSKDSPRRSHETTFRCGSLELKQERKKPYNI